MLPADLDPAELVALGGAVRELRARRRLSQEALGWRGDLHRNYVGAVERGEVNPTFRVLLKLERGLAVPLPELIDLFQAHRTEGPGLMLAPPAPSRRQSGEREAVGPQPRPAGAGGSGCGSAGGRPASPWRPAR
jgi:transcriptional regulator with XRE-family HTH domain